MRILVTGANGQVGHELLRALVQEHIPLAALRARSLSLRPSQAKGEEKHPLRNEGGRAPARGDDIARSKSHPPRSPFLRKGEDGSIVPATRDGRLENARLCERIDLAELDDLRDALDRIAPDLILNAAAYTAVDRAEDEPEPAMRVNAEAVGVIGAWAAAHGARVVHYSTDYVFDGSATRPYREDDATHPLGTYGRSKFAGEVALRDSGARHLIMRTAWVYGARGKNFLRTMLRLGAERDELRVVDDQVGAPTSAGLIADVTAQVVARWFAVDDDASSRLDGTYHLVAAGQTSWCGFARAIFGRVRAWPDREEPSPSVPLPQEGGRAQRGGMSARAPHVTAIRTADYPTQAKRPAYSVLDTTKLRATFEVELPDWRIALDDVMASMRSKTPLPPE